MQRRAVATTEEYCRPQYALLRRQVGKEANEAVDSAAMMNCSLQDVHGDEGESKRRERLNAVSSRREGEDQLKLLRS